MILHVCDEPQFLEIMVLIKQIINIIKIGAPIVLVIMMMLDVVKAVTAGNYDGISKSTKQIPRRLLAAAMIFLVPTVLEFTLNLIDESVDYATCITNANYTTINQMYIDRADTHVVKAENSLLESDLIAAQSTVNLLNDETLKESYKERLKAVSDAIDTKKQAEYQQHVQANKNNYHNSDGNVQNNKDFPYYNQCDSRWKSITLASGGTYNTCNCGCGYAALATVMAGLNKDTQITPKAVVPYVITFSSSKCAISDDTLYSSNLKSRYGISGTVLFARGANVSVEQKKQKIVDSLKSNKPVILLVPGHYITLASISGNNITVLDPGNTANNGTYTIDALYNKYYNHKNRCTTNGSCGFIYAVSYSR